MYIRFPRKKAASQCSLQKECKYRDTRACTDNLNGCMLYYQNNQMEEAENP